MDYSAIIEKKRARLEELDGLITQPGFYDDPRKAGETMKEHTRITKVLEMWDEFSGAQKNLEDNRELMKDGGDEELAALAEAEVPELEETIARLDTEIQYALLPPDPNEDRDALLEIRAGTGGDEASLFAADLFSMYKRWIETMGWKVEPLESQPSEAGGFKEVVVKVTGDDVFRSFKYESGVHRVQRVPATETQGRIHTSTATVAVLPEAEDIDVELKMDELRIEATRSGGPGGQHVNTTDSAVQILHIPTGVMVKCQDGRSQTKNKEKALSILRAKLYEKKVEEENAKYSEHRRSLIGSGSRSEKIRTYNFPQNRVTDHRVGVTLHNLDGVMAGEIDEFTEALQASEMAARLEEAGLAEG